MTPFSTFSYSLRTGSALMSETRLRLLKVKATHIRMDASTADSWAAEVTEHLHVLAKGTHRQFEKSHCSAPCYESTRPIYPPLYPTLTVLPFAPAPVSNQHSVRAHAFLSKGPS